jgi:predicted amidophosphoribosyltransferase
MCSLHIRWLDSILDLIFPETQVCTFCWTQIEGRGSRGICAKCFGDILSISERFVTCPRCGHFIAGKTCPNCYDWTDEIDGVISVVPYDGAYKEKIFNLKYNNKKELAYTLGYLMASRAKNGLLYKRDIIVIPIPLHPLREEERGYNQSALLAQVIARELNCRYEEGVLIRKKGQYARSICG